ncbi:hypothetical protein M501DRAFT_1044660 [Patellaria atrata CBS 101060]|uniref:Hepatocellular carcinoma-associated antigen 59-domain-containing protein n=1 Tax=Patellaria atrata CBS 101060 TaxID=1346257 RepID=A0A9P4S2B0_9PEZI|nr:hypothetical protein M501DRAFT_1044660 [Patellaria atrata CBS 101060]
MTDTDIVSTASPAPPEYIEPTFRPAKRRKVFRKRADERSPPPSISGAESAAVDSRGQGEEDYEGESADHSVVELLRRRKQLRQRWRGIEFKAGSEGGSARDPGSDAVALVEEVEQEAQLVERATGRFVVQTGLAGVGEVKDRHMMAYVDSKLAELRAGKLDTSEHTNTTSSALTTTESNTGIGVPETGRQRQPATLGKLQEVDLGDTAVQQNIARTEAAKRRLETGVDEAEDTHRKHPTRLGKDGKPFRSRKRRNSADVARDKLVEEVLRENRLELYDDGSPVPDPDPAAVNNTDNDDRVAEQFRREFLDQLAAKNVRKQAPLPPNVGKVAKGEERPKGPKLGGSRSARAAMRAAEEKAAAAAKRR